MRFSKQEYWSGLSFPPPGNLPDSGIKPRSPALQAGSLISSDRDAFPLLVQETHFPHGIFISCFQEDKGWSTCIFCTTVSQVTLFFFYFIFKLYITVLVLPNIKMNPPQVWGGRREEGSGWGTHVYLWRIQVTLIQNDQYTKNGIFWSGIFCSSLPSASNILSPCPAFSKTPIK